MLNGPLKHGVQVNIKLGFWQVTLHIAFVHSFVNPLLFLVLHRNTRAATCSLLLCSPEEDAVTPHPAGGKC